MKKSTNVIVEVTKTCGDRFFLVAITDAEGDTHTEKFSEAMMAQMVAHGVKFSYDDTNIELTDAIDNAELGHIEVAEEDGEYDVYYHKVLVDGGELELDMAGEYLKTYKKQASAMAFAKKSAKLVIEG